MKRKISKQHLMNIIEFSKGWDLEFFDLHNIDTGELQVYKGRCRGVGVASECNHAHRVPLALYQPDGSYYNFIVNIRRERETPTFKLGPQYFYYPVMYSFTLGCKIRYENGHSESCKCAECQTLNEKEASFR